MDRFIDVADALEMERFENLKSSMDRFIAYCN